MRNTVRPAVAAIAIVVVAIMASCRTTTHVESDRAGYVDLAPSADQPPVTEPNIPAAVDVDWATSAASLGLEIGDRVTVDLPPDGTRHALWGTYTYSSDSSIGTAAVHAGLISFESGGTVTIEMVDGTDFYLSSQMNGVESGSWGPWGSSFVFVRDGVPVINTVYTVIGWDTSADLFPEATDISLVLPPGGEPSVAWGTDTYTADSSIGTAAVHAGLITFETGGPVTIRRVPGLDEYTGSERNGVTTQSYGPWSQAFVFVY